MNYILFEDFLQNRIERNKKTTDMLTAIGMTDILLSTISLSFEVNTRNVSFKAPNVKKLMTIA
ncbi:hypothetical protein SAMN05518672_105366 [Chitinophaga sp. CF118]|uniref:hypothetical protein n=1 Tax=Chitinophaga sp. CF118 TaxID=1884367 RepID=UPI0008E85E3E|nr:hypothetical protein [Chitinophaga sp. CF118]SFE35111.1 hypothetical protein SAMN05518672_105366 [Chitinophaga sp. CF118]